MVNVIFYEKPGCINNTKQKNLLIDAGHQVESRNLLTEQWSRKKLLEYFESMLINQWFNISAPDIKSGLIDTSNLSQETALELMIQNPILIRRPLIQVGNELRVGFDINEVNQWIGLTTMDHKEMENCPKQSGHSCKSPDANTV